VLAWLEMIGKFHENSKDIWSLAVLEPLLSKFPSRSDTTRIDDDEAHVRIESFYLISLVRCFDEATLGSVYNPKKVKRLLKRWNYLKIYLFSYKWNANE
jgi:hypothetical protein